MIVVPRIPGTASAVPIATVNWPSFPARSEATVHLSWNGTAIHLRFEVSDTAMRALVMGDNGPVWRDRCVEWFVSFDGRNYYNIEVNAVGTLLVQYGPSRAERRFVAPDRLAAIERIPSLGRSAVPFADGPIEWSLALRLPLSFFAPEGHRITRGTEARGNFHLCGDDLPERQYLTHYPIISEKPDFHRPESFGSILFR